MTVESTRPPWWYDDPAERYWIEIRYLDGLGTHLRCPLAGRDGNKNGWYELVGLVRPGDVVYHWHALQNAFVGKSIVVSSAETRGQDRYVSLEGFEPLERIVQLTDIRGHSKFIYEFKSELETTKPGRGPYYLPFQFRRDGLRLMSNYFAKFPRALVELFFEGHEPDTLPEVPEAVIPDTGPSRMAFLEPFRPKADLEYVAQVSGRAERRSRSHETLVNTFANWLVEQGHAPARNRAIDIGLERPSVIFEAKVVNNWSRAIRQAVGQLYEYRYFQVVHQKAHLVFLASMPIPGHWMRYLEEDRDVSCAWFNGVGFTLSDRARIALKGGVL